MAGDLRIAMRQTLTLRIEVVRADAAICPVPAMLTDANSRRGIARVRAGTAARAFVLAKISVVTLYTVTATRAAGCLAAAAARQGARGAAVGTLMLASIPEEVVQAEALMVKFVHLTPKANAHSVARR
jgi:hypothetical protein